MKGSGAWLRVTPARLLPEHAMPRKQLFVEGLRAAVETGGFAVAMLLSVVTCKWGRRRGREAVTGRAGTKRAGVRAPAGKVPLHPPRSADNDARHAPRRASRPGCWVLGVCGAGSGSSCGSQGLTILVKMLSQAGTGFSFNAKRNRLQEKLTLLHFDPIEGLTDTIMLHSSMSKKKKNNITFKKNKGCTIVRRHIKKALSSMVVSLKLHEFCSLTEIKFSCVFMGCKRKDSYINFKQMIRTFLIRNGLSHDNTTLSFLEKKIFWDSRLPGFLPPTECPAGLPDDVCLGACPIAQGTT
ncbi:hypothetical protein MC885_019892 [Smutsia gigantea]|nr:hypothetical protein MC885_019892 [Smutsia gigantea]